MRDLIVFGEDFGALPSSTQHLVRGLAERRKVLWVNSIGLRQPKLSLADLSRAAYKLAGRSKADTMPLGSTEHPNIHIINLRTIPAPASPLARTLAAQMMKKQLLPKIRRLKLNRPVLWASLPTAADLCGSLGESAVIYYCGDDFGSLAGVDHQTVIRHEQKLAQKADLIFAASEALTAKFPAGKTQLLPHGVDVELFGTPCPKAADMPDNGRPVAGFYGSLSNWLDYELIELVIRGLPEWDFVFIGPNELPVLALPDAPNCHYLGPRAHHQLPGYSRHWDAAILPFRDNGQIRACSPLKLMEYLAADRPVITTPFPAMEKFRSHVSQVQSAEQMIHMLSHVRGTRCDTRHLVSDDSWKNRSQWVELMLELL